MSTNLELIYCSVNNQHLEFADIAEMVKLNNFRNSRDGIKSMLLFNQQFFCQILQGEANKVLDTFTRIKNDPRHSEVTIKLIRTDRFLPLSSPYGVHLVGFRESMRTIYKRYSDTDHFNPFLVESRDLEHFLVTLETERMKKWAGT